MANVINPMARVVIYGSEVLTISDLVIEFDVTKTMSDHPNEAEITVINLEADKRNRILDPSYKDIPIDLYISNKDSDELVLLYNGEIDSVENRALRPGYATTISCLSQREEHTAKYMEKTYAVGTTYEQMINDILAVIDMPYESADLPTATIKMPYSFDAPAFKILQRLCRDCGLFAYINDGTLYVSDFQEPVAAAEHIVDRTLLLEPPKLTKRIDIDHVERETLVNVTKIDPFAQKRKVKKRVKEVRRLKSGRRKISVVTQDGEGFEDEPQFEASFEAVDSEIFGADFRIFANPNIQTNDIVALSDDEDTKYRVIEVETFGDNDGGDWDTMLKCDDYEPEQV